jgi:hypothetical protein
MCAMRMVSSGPRHGRSDAAANAGTTSVRTGLGAQALVHNGSADGLGQLGQLIGPRGQEAVPQQLRHVSPRAPRASQKELKILFRVAR